MNGKEHYEEAERLLREESSRPVAVAGQIVAIAQVHATLAAVQAQLAIATSNTRSDEQANIWHAWGEKL